MRANLSELQQIRLEKAQALRERGDEPYPTRADRTHTAQEAIERFERLESDAGEEFADDESITVAGRVVSYRNMGKTVFAHLRDGSGQIQLYVRRDVVGDDAFSDFLKLVDLGDILQASGSLFRTKTGEVSLRVSEFAILA